VSDPLDVLDPALARASAALRVATLGSVRAFARGTTTAIVGRLIGAVSAAGQSITLSDSPAARVLLPRGGGYAVAFDLEAGDRGVLLAADSGWDASWVSGAPSIPGSGLRHTYGSAALLPGGRLESEPATHAVGEMRIGAEDASATIDLRRRRGGVLGQVTITATSPLASVKLGGPLAVTPLAKAPDTTLAIVAGWTAFNATIQADATVAVPLKLSIAAATTAAIAAVNAVPIAAVKVVAE